MEEEEVEVEEGGVTGLRWGGGLVARGRGQWGGETGPSRRHKWISFTKVNCSRLINALP